MDFPVSAYIVNKNIVLGNFNNISGLLRRYINNDCTPQEVAYLLDYFKADENEAQLKMLILEQIESYQPEEEAPDSMNEVFAKVKNEITLQSQIKTVPFYKRAWVRVAAAAIITVGVSVILFQQSGRKVLTKSDPIVNQNIITSAKDNALLTLADGTTIMLDSVNNGVLTEQEGIQIVKLNGVIIYNPTNKSSDYSISRNTITTSRGNKYQLQLADGTKIWLNAGSSISYPVAFTEKERRISLRGEGFFDVAHNSAKPFVANVLAANGESRGEIRVLGTRFNVNNYDDEKEVKTLLVEGSIKFVENNKTSHLIKPGEQIILDKTTSKVKISKVNTQKDVAWKDELFRFEGDNIQTIMRQLSRWYDVDVTYNGEVGNETFTGIISRSSDIGEVMKILETGGFKFKQEGRNITVTK